MKKLFLMGFVALGLASCVSDKEVTQLTEEQKTTQQFENLFVGTFGQPDANQTWVYNTPIINADAMRSTSSNGNQWGESWYVPKPLHADQKAIVTAYFTNVEDPQGVSIDYKNFFCQHVSSTERGKSNMDFFYCGTDNDHKDHVGNYNAGDEGNYKDVFGGELKGLPTDDWNDRKVYYGDKIQLQVETSTANFGYHNSYDSEYRNRYVIIPGNTIMAWAKDHKPELITANADVSGMHFLGFDYEHDKRKMGENNVVEPDNYYNDWVIRITQVLRSHKVVVSLLRTSVLLRVVLTSITTTLYLM